jgi:hypothetical protein
MKLVMNSKMLALSMIFLLLSCYVIGTESKFRHKKRLDLKVFTQINLRFLIMGVLTSRSSGLNIILNLAEMVTNDDPNETIIYDNTEYECSIDGYVKVFKNYSSRDLHEQPKLQIQNNTSPKAQCNLLVTEVKKQFTASLRQSVHPGNPLTGRPTIGFTYSNPVRKTRRDDFFEEIGNILENVGSQIKEFVQPYIDSFKNGLSCIRAKAEEYFNDLFYLTSGVVHVLRALWTCQNKTQIALLAINAALVQAITLISSVITGGLTALAAGVISLMTIVTQLILAYIDFQNQKYDSYSFRVGSAVGQLINTLTRRKKRNNTFK